MERLHVSTGRNGMRKHRRFVPAVLVLMLALVGMTRLIACRRAPTTDSRRATSLTLDALRNAAYPSAFAEDGTARLKSGLFEEWPIPNAASHTTIVLSDDVAHGDLNGDEATDAAVILVANSGGTGNFRELIPVVNENGTPKPLKGLVIGDRVRIESFTIENGRIVVTMRTQGPNDPMSDPTWRVRRIYALRDGKLIRLSETENPSQ